MLGYRPMVSSRRSEQRNFELQRRRRPLDHFEGVRVLAPNAAEKRGKDCPVCLDNFDDASNLEVVSTACNHLFHSTCLSEWVHRRQNCALCRAPVTVRREVLDAEAALPPQDGGCVLL
jgi:hypothetical protein